MHFFYTPQSQLTCFTRSLPFSPFSVRLWSLATFTNVVVYKGHLFPVWDVSFSPLGLYFASASHDRTARLWNTESIAPLRVFAGHLSDVDVSARRERDLWKIEEWAFDAPLVLLSPSFFHNRVSGFTQTATTLPLAAATARCGCGTCKQATACACFRGTPTPSTRSRSPPRAAFWPLLARTRTSSSGTLKAGAG